jgi:EcoRII C terminal
MSVIRHGYLSDLFTGVVAKTLTLVETITPRSNQHEFQGTKPFKALFGTEDRRGIPTRFIWLAEEQAAVTEDGFISWSNVRKGKPRAPEFHLYYSGNAVTEAMMPGDTMFLALRQDGDALVIVAPAATTMQNQLRWLFGLPQQNQLFEEYRDIGRDREAELDFAARYILDELGIEFEEPEAARLDTLVEKFGLTFPDTLTLSGLARSSLPDVDARATPDAAIVTWMEREEQLFRRLERRIVEARLKSNFMAGNEADVDGFLSFSLSVQNRRKSRAGRALENHLEALFNVHGLRFARGVETENRNRPDFLFPGQAEYRDTAYPTSRLTMLGAKSTLKDRWRQVLSEATRIETKHLLTLEPGLSVNQTNEMQAKRLQLVVPDQVRKSYTDSQCTWLMNVVEFISLIKKRSAV